MNTAKMLETAMRDHRSGRLEEAGAIYQQILDTHPEQPDALHLLGVVAYQKGDMESASSLIGKAISINPQAPEYKCNLGNVFRELGRDTEAIACYEDAINLRPDFAEAYNNMGTCLRRASKIPESIECYRKAIENNSGYAEAYNNLGNILKEIGEIDQAIVNYQQVVRHNPNHSGACNILGKIFLDKGDHEKAFTYLSRAIALKPDLADAHVSLARLLKDTGKTREAIASCRKAIELRHDYADAFHVLGTAYFETGNFDNAIDSFQKELVFRPEDAQAHNSLGIAMHQAGKQDAALSSDPKAIEIDSDSPKARGNQCGALHGTRRGEEAVESFRRAIHIRPDFAEAYNNLAIALKGLKRYEDAHISFQKALSIKPDYTEAHINDGNTYREQCRYTEALSCYQKAIELDPLSVDAHTKTAYIYSAQGRVNKAIHHFREAVRINPDDASTHSNLLLSLHYQNSIDLLELFRKHKRWGKRYERPSAKDNGLPANDRTPGRLLRIGYVSPDFRTHSVAYFLEAILASHDDSDFAVFCYSDVAVPDDTTKRMRALAKNWRDICRLKDEQVAHIIRSDKIDILIDLAGHTANNRLTLFALGPAPVQVTYLGYPDTTGLPTMHYRITDSLADPPGTSEHLFTERLLRVPRCFLCYRPPARTPDVVEPPMRKSGEVTFGSFNNRSKITHHVVRVWSDILKRLPESHLLLKSRALADAETRQSLLDIFVENGVRPDRIRFIGSIPTHFDHLDLYNSVDIALDTFPYNGTTTTCEALWMGVPVIALRGEAHFSRVGVSLLSNAGLEEFIADTPDDYVKKAVSLASNPDRLLKLRKKQRTIMARSPLMDASGFTKELENEYRRIWVRWCSNELPPSELREMNPAEMKQGPLKEGVMTEEHTQSTKNHDRNTRQSPSEQSIVLIREGEAHFHSGQIEDAQKAFDKALELDPGNVSALNNLGVLSWQKGDVDAATERFERVLKIDPCNEDATHNLQEIQAVQQNSVEQKNTESTQRSDQSDETCLRVTINGEIQVCVPPSIQFMTPYILVEQEDWFEDEIHYIRRALHKGMNVIDIGANYGLYTLTMSKIIGTSGRIWAFEPTSLTADFLRKSISANQMTNIVLTQAGLSDQKGTAQISLNPNPELNAITADPDSGGEYETVELTSLDECEKIFDWDEIDFIKLDAEGQEHNIIRGAKHFLSTRSPLIMFELKHGDTVNVELMHDFSKLGYQLYHLVPGLNILAPVDSSKPFDPFQLNLFCCKKDRAQLLQEQGLLITEIPSPAPISAAVWQQGLKDLPYFNVFMPSWASVEQGETLTGWDHYENALNCYVMAHTETRTVHDRYASLHRAWKEVSRALEENATLPRLITQVRIQSELGKRGDSLHTVDTILKLIESEKTVRLSEPFIPISPRFGLIIPEEMNKWLLASLLEFREKAKAFSSFYSGRSSLDHLELIKQLGYQTPEMERRRQLIRMRYGLQHGPVSTPLVSRKAQDNLNPEFWKTAPVSGPNPRNIAALLGITLEGRIQIVDIGAMDIGEEQNPYMRLLSGDLACIVGFEPLEQECRKLNKSSANNRKFLPYAVGDGTKKPFYITNTGMTSSLYEPNHDLTIKFQNLDELMQVIKTEEMQTVRLDDVPEILDTDFLKIDVQGAEKMILENAARVLQDTLVIQTEVEFVPLYKNQPLFADVDRTLREHGFAFHKFLGTAGRTFKPFYVKGNINKPISQMLWADAIYVKNFMELETLSEQKLLKYAIIMHEVFRSLDLCHLVLAQYDRKTGMDLSQRYLHLIEEGSL